MAFSNIISVSVYLTLIYMFSKRNITLSAKVSLCAMLMLLTASVASASVAGNFGFTDVGDSYVTSSSTNNLALEVVIPDGINGNTPDLLLKAGGTAFYSGDALVPFPILGSVTGVGYKEDGTGGFQGTEPVVRDLDADGVWTAGGDTIIDGSAPAAGTPIYTTKDGDWSDLYFYDAAGGGAWAAGTDMIFSDDGTIVHDSGLDTLIAGGNVNDAFSLSTVPASWNFGFYDAVNADAYNGTADWIGIDDDGDLVLTTAADTLVIDGTDALPGAGAALYSIGIADNVCSDNIVMASATCVYTDTDGTPCDGTQGSGADIVGVGCEVGGDTLIAGVSNWATNKGTLDATTDWFTENVAGPFTYSAAADTLIDGVAPGAGTLISSSKDSDWANMYFHYFAPAAPWDPINDLVFLDDGNVYYDTGGFTADVLEAGVAVTTQPGTLTEPGNWNLWFSDAVNSNAYDDNVDWIGVDAGGTGTYSASADDDVYTTGGLVNLDLLTNFIPDCDGIGVGTQACLHTGGGTIDATKSILVDEGNDQGAAPNGVVDEATDQLNDIEIQNDGTAPITDLTAVNVWADGGDDTFDAGPGDDIFLGAATWDAADSWDLNALVYPITAGGIKLFVSIDINSNPTHGQTFILALPQNGVTVASTNDGPTDADASPGATNNTKTTYNTASSGGGGSSGGSSYECGNNNVDEGETCDDGGRTSGDGCNAYCELEEGYVWDAASEEAVIPTEEETTTEEIPVDAEAVTEEDLPAEEVADVSDNFSDYDATHWAAEYIAKLYNAGIMSGPGDGTFGVAVGTTRAEIVKIALLANGIEVPASVDEAPFLDTPIGEWYAPYVAKAAELGIVSGYGDGNFRPGNTVNRAEALKILLLAKGVDLEGYDLSSATSFSDVSESIWYAVYVAYGVDMGLVEGYDDGTFRAINDILRAEIAKLTVVIMLLDLEV